MFGGSDATSTASSAVVEGVGYDARPHLSSDDMAEEPGVLVLDDEAPPVDNNADDVEMADESTVVSLSDVAIRSAVSVESQSPVSAYRMRERERQSERHRLSDRVAVRWR